MRFRIRVESFFTFRIPGADGEESLPPFCADNLGRFLRFDSNPVGVRKRDLSMALRGAFLEIILPLCFLGTVC